MSDVTHGKCPACKSYQPILWEKVHTEQVYPDGRADVFDGMNAKCRRCDFEIASLGTISERDYA